MTSLAARGVFCCLECCCTEVVQALRRLLGNERVSKIFYVFLVVAFVVPGIFIFFFIHRFQSFVDYFSAYFKCPQSSQGGQFECFGASAIYRLSLSLLCMFFIMMLLMICRNRCAMVLNQGLFFMKYVFVVAVFIAFLWVPNQVFIEYAEASKYLAILFMVLQVCIQVIMYQVIILIDLFYMGGIRMVRHYDAGESRYGCYLIFLTLVIEAAAITLNILGYITFSNNQQGCTRTLWVNVVNSIIIILLPVLQFFNFNVQNSLLTTSLVSLYISYLSYISQFSYPDSSTQCQRMSLESLIADVIVSTFFFILTMYGSIQGGSGQVKVTANGDLNKAMGVAPSESTDRGDQKDHSHSLREQLQVEKEDQMPLSYSDWTWAKWHFYMCLSSMYVGMLITNWGAANLTTNTLEPTSFGFWVRVSLSYTTTILYIWTLIAPKVFPDRDFIVQ